MDGRVLGVLLGRLGVHAGSLQELALLEECCPCSISARAASLTAPLALGLGAAAAASDVGELLWVGLLMALRGGMLLLGAASR